MNKLIIREKNKEIDRVKNILGIITASNDTPKR